MNEQFLNRSKGMDVFLWACEFGASKFLAATTALLSYSWVETITPSLAGQMVGVGLVFLGVDFGITELMRFYFLERSQKESDSKARTLFLRFIASIVAFKLIATATTSFWAAPDLAEYITGDAKTEYFAERIQEEQNTNLAKMDAARSVWEKLENSEATRVREAERKGAALVKQAIESGTIHQVDMYKRNPGFFYALNRSSQYYRTNKAYIDRINAAKAKAEAMVEAERGETQKALQAYESTNRDTSATATLSFLNAAATNDLMRHEARISRRTNFLWMLDFFSAIGLILIVRARTLRLEAGDHKGRQKTIVSALAAISERRYTDMVNWLERFANVDLNGDGTIGGRGSKKSPEEIAPVRSVSDDDFELKRKVETLMAKVETLRPETVETVNRETETVKGPLSVSVSPGEAFHWDVETVKGAVKEAVREVSPETVETVRETVETELKRKPETVIVETVKHAPPKRKKPETVETVETVRGCLSCGSDISHKRATAKFCGPECKNEFHNAKR